MALYCVASIVEFGELLGKEFFWISVSTRHNKTERKITTIIPTMIIVVKSEFFI
jgi:hypothetical protein